MTVPILLFLTMLGKMVVEPFLPSGWQNSALACRYMDVKQDSFNLTRILLTAILVASLAGLLALLAIGLSHRSSATGRSGLRLVGKQAPDFSISSYTGEEIALSDVGGHPLVINFWASWCPPCREESALLERIWREYESTGIYFLGINVQDSREAGEAYIDEFGITFVNGIDADGRVSIDYGVVGLPVSFFVDGDGVIAGRWVGAMSEEGLRVWIEDLLEESFPNNRFTKSVIRKDQANWIYELEAISP